MAHRDYTANYKSFDPKKGKKLFLVNMLIDSMSGSFDENLKAAREKIDEMLESGLTEDEIAQKLIERKMYGQST